MTSPEHKLTVEIPESVYNELQNEYFEARKHRKMTWKRFIEGCLKHGWLQIASVIREATQERE